MNISKERKLQMWIAVVAISLLLMVCGIYRIIRHRHHLRHLNYKVLKHTQLHEASVASAPEAEIVAIHLLAETTAKYVTPQWEETTPKYVTPKTVEAPAKYVTTQSEEVKNLTVPGVTIKVALNADCLHCLCMTVSGCKPTKCSKHRPCGIYEISKYYWTDGGKLTTTDNLYDYNEEDAEYRDYLRCVNNEQCAKETVNGYMQLYQRDCNDDGVIDCRDYIALHLLGPSGCRSKQLTAYHKLRMNSCLN